MSATLLKSARTTAIAILSASTIAVTSGATPLPGIDHMPTVKLTSDTSYIYGNDRQYDYDPNTFFGLENAQNQRYYDMLTNQAIQQAILNAAINGQQHSTVPDYDPTTSADYGLGNPFDLLGSMLLMLDEARLYLLVSLGQIFGSGPLPALLGNILDTPLNILSTAGHELHQALSASFLGVTNMFSASAVDPLLAVGAASADSSFVTDLFNDALGGNPDGAIADLSAALSDMSPAF